MQQDFTADNWEDDDGMPAGGYVEAQGLRIDWQNGPLRTHGDEEPDPPNGAFVETVLAAARQRLAYYQTAASGRFYCIENELAIDYIDRALLQLNERTAQRTERGVEGTHQP